jgi:hypothetical protein
MVDERGEHWWAVAKRLGGYAVELWPRSEWTDALIEAWTEKLGGLAERYGEQAVRAELRNSALTERFRPTAKIIADRVCGSTEVQQQGDNGLTDSERMRRQDVAEGGSTPYVLGLPTGKLFGAVLRKDWERFDRLLEEAEIGKHDGMGNVVRMPLDERAAFVAGLRRAVR